MIYWYYKQSGTVLAESQRFAEEISRTTGNYLDDNYTALDTAGYKDWARATCSTLKRRCA
ncbi:MAG: hypothetical protein II857_10775 [Selenomonadaceae bacterium]|nr:hypothetical protein [Selenomonadaceae bacterium]